MNENYEMPLKAPVKNDYFPPRSTISKIKSSLLLFKNVYLNIWAPKNTQLYIYIFDIYNIYKETQNGYKETHNDTVMWTTTPQRITTHKQQQKETKQLVDLFSYMFAPM